MGEIARWNGHSFTVSANLIRSFNDFSIKGSSDTEDKTSDKEAYVSRKNGSPREISLTAQLNAMLGCDVQTEAMAFVKEAYAGKSDFFYCAGKKLLTCKLMLTDASADKIEMDATGRWIRAEVKLTFKQSTKDDGTTGGSSSGGGGSSSKKTSVKTQSTTSSKSSGSSKKISTKTQSKIVSAALGGVSSVIASTQTTVARAGAAIAAIKKTVNAAKKASNNVATAVGLAKALNSTKTLKTLPVKKK